MTDKPTILKSIREFAAGFEGRLSGEKLDDATEYLDHNESWLSLYLLGQHLIEEDVQISTLERHRFEELAASAGGELERFRSLDLITRDSEEPIS